MQTSASLRESWRSRGVAFLAALCLLAVPGRAHADPPPPPFPGCATGTLPSGAFSLVCIPFPGWNGGLVIYAHGYVNFDEPLQLLPDGTSIPALILSQGFAFATTSYRQNGLAILEGAEDISELAAAFRRSHGQVPTYIVGGSEGGLVATLMVEQSGLFLGGLAACGPIGNFRGQIDYFGDFRVLFDYYFPGFIPGEAVAIPPTVIRNWYTNYYGKLYDVLIADPTRTDELLRVAHVPHPFSSGLPETFAIQATFALDVLRYNIFGTKDAFRKLGGHSFDNRDRIYTGSSDDVDLNRRVHRFNAQKAALRALQAYETSGNLSKPLVTLHTTGDHVIPFLLHEPPYLAKVLSHDAGVFLVQDAVQVYGHCNFQAADLMVAFGTLRQEGGF